MRLVGSVAFKQSKNWHFMSCPAASRRLVDAPVVVVVVVAIFDSPEWIQPSSAVDGYLPTYHDHRLFVIWSTHHLLHLAFRVRTYLINHWSLWAEAKGRGKVREDGQDGFQVSISRRSISCPLLCSIDWCRRQTSSKSSQSSGSQSKMKTRMKEDKMEKHTYLPVCLIRLNMRVCVRARAR